MEYYNSLHLIREHKISINYENEKILFDLLEFLNPQELYPLNSMARFLGN